MTNAIIEWKHTGYMMDYGWLVAPMMVPWRLQWSFRIGFVLQTALEMILWSEAELVVLVEKTGKFYQ